jgi:hypothetical protein
MRTLNIPAGNLLASLVHGQTLYLTADECRCFENLDLQYTQTMLLKKALRVHVLPIPAEP